MEEILGRRYKLKSSENFEEYMKYLGVGLLLRKTGNALSPVSCLIKNPDGSYTFTMSTTLRSIKTTFRLGEEFCEERADGVKVKSVITLEGTKLLQIQTEESGKQSRHLREFSPDILKVTTTADGWDNVCVRTYELVK